MHSKRILLVAACALATFGCSKKEEEKDAQAVVPVQVAPAVKDRIRRIVTADGILWPRDQANVIPKIAAPVQKFTVQRGDHVRQGQLLAVLENRDLAAAIAESRGQFEQAESNLRSTSAATVPEQVVKAQTDLEAAREAEDAGRKLLENRKQLLEEGALARKLVDDAQVAFAQAHGQYLAAQEHLRALQSVSKGEQIKTAAAQVEAARGHLQSAEAQLAYSEIRSPVTGVIADRPLYAGEMSSPGTPLLTVMDISSIIARVNVPQGDVRNIRVGDAATITSTDSGLETPAKVTIVSPATDPNSTTVQVWVQAENKGERLKPGTSVHVAIVTATIPDAIVVPAAALLPASGSGTSVMVVTSDNVAHERKVEVGALDLDKAQILSGVSAGEQVVTVGGIGLQDKAKVKILKPGEKSDEDEKDGKEK